MSKSKANAEVDFAAKFEVFKLYSKNYRSPSYIFLFLLPFGSYDINKLRIVAHAAFSNAQKTPGATASVPERFLWYFCFSSRNTRYVQQSTQRHQ